MGHVYASVKFANPRDIEEGRREKMVEERALVDIGATFTTVPRSLAKKLALPIMGKVKVRTASGEEVLDQSLPTRRRVASLPWHPCWSVTRWTRCS